MVTTITAFQRGFREARETADRGQPVLITSGDAEYIFMRHHHAGANPFKGLEDVFGAVSLGTTTQTHREKIRARLAANRRR
jgi:hypothetical protein